MHIRVFFRFDNTKKNEINDVNKEGIERDMFFAIRPLIISI